ncbi:hypothetical protein M9458_015569, partial [Cirrhinus mrigala]
NDSIVAGGGAIEMELSKYLRDYSRTIPGKQQLLIGAYAKALEVIPRQLCDNAGFDATNILNKLRAKHAQGGMWYGVDVNNEDIADNFQACVWEPSIVRINALTAASEAAPSRTLALLSMAQRHLLAEEEVVVDHMPTNLHPSPVMSWAEPLD